MSNTTIITKSETPIISNPNSLFLGGKSENFSLQQIKNSHIIPVFSADNMPTISQAEFISVTESIAADVFNEKYTSLAVKLSHPRKGRTFEARGKKAAELLSVSIPMIDKLIRSGKLKKYKIGSKTLLDSSQVESLLQ